MIIPEMLGHYRILQKLGEGGMGVVYQALDTHLDRMVALKILPPEMVADPERKRRFVQEAKAASALNHPHIVTIYDIATDQGMDFISMEFIEGKTLDEHIPREGMKPSQAAPLAIAIADALAKAHAAGIVHRDLKPTNIMINAEGRPKILDFGLAKLSDRTEPGSNDRTLVQKPATEQGTILGTVNYMSPEQAEGRKIDARSDVFSFGAVLYELLTGQRAFSEETPVGTIAAVIGKEPPLSVNAELGKIVQRCLRKDRERRYQSIADVRIALEDADLTAVTATNPEQPARRRWVWPITALACALLAVTALLYRPTQQAPAAPVFSRLTTAPGLNLHPSIWAPGKLVAYASDRAEGNLDIWIQQLSGGEPRRLTADPADEQEPSFSTDGARIVFRSSRDGGGIYVIPALGGAERKIADGGHHPRFSPDGKWIAYWTGYVNSTLSFVDEIHIVPSGGGPPRSIRSARWPIWSPDGSRLLYMGIDHTTKRSDWHVAPLDSLVGQPTGMTVIAGRDLQPSAWLGNFFYYSSSTSSGATIQRIRVDGTGRITGKPEPLTHGAGEAIHPSPSESLLAFTQMEQNADIWALPLETNSGRVTGPLKRLTTDLGPDTQPSIDRAGRWLAYSARRVPRTFDLMLLDLESGKERNLTSMPQGDGILARGASPKLSADGLKIFYTNRSDSKGYWIPSAGGVPKAMCDCNVRNNSNDPDRVLVNTREGTFLVHLKTGAKQQILSTTGNALKLSWDDRWLTFYRVLPGSKSRVWIVPVGDRVTPESDWIAVNDGNTLDMIPEFSPDGNRLYFLSERDGNRCIWTQRLDPATKRPVGAAEPVHHFHAAHFSPIHNVAGSNEAAVARDKIVLPVTEQTSSIWLAEWPDAKRD